jgi:hypothetical protein
MSARGTLAAIAEELTDALHPLMLAFEDEDAFTGFLALLGWNASGVIQPIQDLGSAVSGAIELVGDEGVEPARALELVGRLGQLFTRIRALATISAGSLGGAIDVTEFQTDFPGQLLDFLVVDHLQHRRPKIGRLLQLFGVIRLREMAETPTRPAYVRREVDWRAFVGALRDPTAPFRAAYRFGQSDFDGVTFLDVVYELARGHGLNTAIGLLSPAERAFLRQGAAPGVLTPLHNSVIRWVIGENPFETPPIRAGLGVAITPEMPGHLPGFALLPFVEGIASSSFLLTPSVMAELKAAFSMAGGVALRVRPGESPTLDVGFGGGNAAGAVEVSVGIDLLNPGGGRRVLLGDPGASRLEVGKLALRGGTRVPTGSTPSAFVELEALDGSIVIAPSASDADGFLVSILPRQWQVDFGGTLGFDAANGLYFTGSAGLEIELPTHIRLGPIELQAAQIAIRLRDDAAAASIPIELTATLTANLGPLKGTVENVGVRATLAFPDAGGRLGPLDFSLGFRPPNGVGVAIDTAVVRGGGFLRFDPEKGEYGGTFELSLFDVVTVQAVGLITTRMPDGSRGFSLLIILTADFGAGIQLGFGFALLAAGGLLGWNRTMRLDTLAQGIRTGALDTVLFPHDVVENAPRILSDLRAIFPPGQGTFLIGPMAKLGWGTPPLVTLSLGVLIEIPGNVAIVGVLRVALPAADAPLLVLQVSFLGAIEFDRQRVWFFASLFESRILFVPIDGEMGVLYGFGAESNFVVSVGGFHPRFSAPPLPFPTPNRVAVSLLNRSTARILATGYFAITTNTAQFGARVELFFGFSFAKLDGELAFDALFRFTPFSFIVEISGKVAFKVFGVGLFSIRLELTLEGPTPYRAHGRGKVSLWLVSFSANFNVTWGDDAPVSLPPLEVMPLLAREFNKPESWTAVAPDRNKLLVSLRPHDPLTGGVLLHPLGTLRVAQRAVPLHIVLAKVGNSAPADGRTFSLRISGGALVRLRDAEEKFAPAQFRELSDADKLSAPAFEREHAGLELTAPGDEAKTSRAVQRSVRYEEIIIDSNFKRAASPLRTRGALLFSHLLAGGAVARSPLSEANRRARSPFSDRVTVDDGAFVVAFTRDNTPAGANTTFSSASAAQDFVAREVARDPSLVRQLHVIPAFELNDAA